MIAAAIPARMTATAYGVAFVVSPVFGILLLVPLLLEVLDGVELPGVAFVKGLRDLISGDLVSGMSRVSEAFLTAGAIAVGVGVVLDFWIKIGG